jgi:hypothetical protein
MSTHNYSHTETTAFKALIRELWWLLPQVSFETTRGSYVKGDLSSVLVDTEPGETPGTFHAGLTIFPLTQKRTDTEGIGIALTGQVDGAPHMRLLRRGVTNRRGSLTLRDLPAGRYHLLLTRSLVAPQEPLQLLTAAAGYATHPVPLLFQEYRAEDDTLTCVLHETREREFMLDIEVLPPKDLDTHTTGIDIPRQGDKNRSTELELWVEYVVAEVQEPDRIVTVERDGQTVVLAGRVALRPDAAGHYTTRTTLGHHLGLPAQCSLRAYVVASPLKEKDEADGQLTTS